MPSLATILNFYEDGFSILVSLRYTLWRLKWELKKRFKRSESVTRVS